MHDTGNQNVPIVVTSDLFSNACENNPYKTQKVWTECYKGLFSYRGGMLQKSLPTEIKASESKAILKRKLASTAGKQTVPWIFYRLYILFFRAFLHYLLLFQYGFHVKKFCKVLSSFLQTLWKNLNQLRIIGKSCLIRQLYFKMSKMY